MTEEQLWELRQAIIKAVTFAWLDGVAAKLSEPKGGKTTVDLMQALSDPTYTAMNDLVAYVDELIDGSDSTTMH